MCQQICSVLWTVHDLDRTSRALWHTLTFRYHCILSNPHDTLRSRLEALVEDHWAVIGHPHDISIVQSVTIRVLHLGQLANLPQQSGITMCILWTHILLDPSAGLGPFNIHGSQDPVMLNRSCIST